MNQALAELSPFQQGAGPGASDHAGRSTRAQSADDGDPRPGGSVLAPRPAGPSIRWEKRDTKTREEMVNAGVILPSDVVMARSPRSPRTTLELDDRGRQQARKDEDTWRSFGGGEMPRRDRNHPSYWRKQCL